MQYAGMSRTSVLKEISKANNAVPRGSSSADTGDKTPQALMLDRALDLEELR